MKSFASKILLPILDQIMLILSFLFFYWLSFNRELSPDKEYLPLSAYWRPCLVINIFWLLLFALFGLYGKWKNSSRFDEIISVYKTITVGAIFFLIFSFWVSQEVSVSKLPILGYWASLVILVGVGRVSIRSIQRYLLLKGIGLRPSIIVGETKLAAEMLRNIKCAPALGYDVKGVITIDSDSNYNKI